MVNYLDVLGIWKWLATKYVCRHFDCKDCENILHIENCPNPFEKNDDITNFIINVTDKLVKLHDNNIEVTEEEFISILENSL